MGKDPLRVQFNRYGLLPDVWRQLDQYRPVRSAQYVGLKLQGCVAHGR